MFRNHGIHLWLTAILCVISFAAHAEKNSDDAKEHTLFLEWELEKDTLYAKENTTAVLYVYSDSEIQVMRCEPLKANKKYELAEVSFYPRRQVVTLDNKRYVRIPVQAYRLTPLASGKLTIESPAVEVTALTYSRQQRGFFYYDVASPFKFNLSPIKTTLTVKRGVNPDVDRRRFPISTAQIHADNLSDMALNFVTYTLFPTYIPTLD